MNKIRVKAEKKIPPVKELRKICQTPESALHDSWYGTNFVRRVSIYLTKFFLYTPITGNQVTILWCIVGITAGILFAFGNYWYSIIGALLLQLLYVLDGTDGEVSRYRGTCSLKGEYLDRLCHNVVYPSIFVGISFGVYANFHSIWAFIFGFSASIFFLQMWLVELERFKIINTAGKDVKNEGVITTITKQKGDKKIESSLLKLFSKIIDPIHIDVIMGVILIGAILDYMHLVLLFYGFALPCIWLVQVYFNLKYKF